MNKQFKGGNLNLHSGGIGPDDYLFKTLPNGRWTKVIIRHGKGPEKAAEYKADLAALGKILRSCEQTCVSDNAKKFRATTPTMSASEFLAQSKGE